MKLIAISFLCAGSLFLASPAMCARGPGAADSKTGGQQISEEAARNVARDRVPGSAIERAKLEREDGKLIWSVHLRPNGSNDVQEVNIDAYTGLVLNVEDETPQKEAEESRRDRETSGVN